MIKIFCQSLLRGEANSSEMAEAIVIEDLCKYYGNFLALDHFSLKVKRGEDVGLLGPNGAGKTTTMKILCGMLFPSHGEAYLDGFDVVRQRERALSRVGAIVETPEFYPFLNPVETLEYLGKLRGMKRGLSQEIKRVLELVGLEEWERVRIGKFSRGMKQRLAIAQALLHDPPILILDEPALGLDPKGMAEVREILSGAKKRRTIFYASHLLSEVSQVCEKVALIDRGRLLAYDRIERLRKKLTGPPRVEVQVLKPPTSAQLRKIGRMKSVEWVSAKGNKIELSFRGGKRALSELLEGLRELGLEVVSFKPVELTLEEIYLKLMEEA